MKLHAFIAKVQSISPEHQKGSTRFKNIIVCKPAPTDDFGEKIGKDDIFKIAVFNDRIDKIPANIIGKIVELNCYLQGTEFLQEGKEIIHNLNLVLSGIKLAEVKKEF